MTLKQTALGIIAIASFNLLIGCAATSPFAAPEKTSAQTQQKGASDRDIELAIGKAIYTDPTLKHKVHITVTSFQGIVLLTGEAANPALRNHAVEHARKAKHVKRVHNELLVGPNSSLASRSQDTLISTRVKGSLSRDDRLNNVQIKTLVENQAVYLMGRVTRAQATIATNIARQIGSVKEVVILFDYID